MLIVFCVIVDGFTFGLLFIIYFEWRFLGVSLIVYLCVCFLGYLGVVLGGFTWCLRLLEDWVECFVRLI